MSENENEGQVEEATVIFEMENPDPTDLGNTLVVATKDGKTAKSYYNFGEDLESMIEKFGEQVVHANAKANMVIRYRAVINSAIKSNGNIAELPATYVPGVAMPKSPKDMNKATENYFMTLSAEEQDAMISKLMERKGA